MRTVTSLPVGGTVFTTASGTGADSITIVTRSQVPSVVSPLGPVTLHQPQLVQPTALQDTALQDTARVPACGTLSIDHAVLTGADGVTSLSYSCVNVPFSTDERITEPGGLHPIVFAGEFTLAGGTGTLLGASGSLYVTGRHSFTDNAGYFTLAGTIELPTGGW
jgi:hypothetical protein